MNSGESRAWKTLFCKQHHLFAPGLSNRLSGHSIPRQPQVLCWNQCECFSLEMRVQRRRHTNYESRPEQCEYAICHFFHLNLPQNCSPLKAEQYLFQMSWYAPGKSWLRGFRKGGRDVQAPLPYWTHMRCGIGPCKCKA